MEAADSSEMPESSIKVHGVIQELQFRILSAVMPTNPIKCLIVFKPSLLCDFFNKFVLVCVFFVFGSRK